MNELSLFTGAGGGILGTKLLGFRHIGYVENNAYCQNVIKQRIIDGVLDAAPIFGDIRQFISGGFANAYKGLVDVVTGGFPCQPFSIAGKGLAQFDPRNMWPETIKTICIIKPRFCFLENVPGLLPKPYFRTILREIAEAGYDCQWDVFGADDIGANHRRKRLWIFCYPKHLRPYEAKESESDHKGIYGNAPREIKAGEPSGPGEQDGHLANAERIGEKRTKSKHGEGRRTLLGGEGQDVANAKSAKCEQPVNSRRGRDGLTDARANVSNTQKLGLQGRDDGRYAGSELPEPREDGGAIESWWLSEPNVGRVAHGVARRVDRLRALGNGQVPGVVKQIWKLMSNRRLI